MRSIFALLIIFFLSSKTCNAQFISDDDKLHFGAGVLISSATYAFVYSKTKNKSKAFWMSLGVSALAGLSKEIYDSTKKGNKFDTGEAIATTTGGLTASVTFNIFTRKKKSKKMNNTKY